MKLEFGFNLTQMAGQRPFGPMSVVARDFKKVLLGCAQWNRRESPQTKETKNATLGIVVEVEISQRTTGGHWEAQILNTTEDLANVVYPLVQVEPGFYFVGCRNGMAYFMDKRLKVGGRPAGVFDGGIYGVALAPERTLVLGGRNGTLTRINYFGAVQKQWKLGNDRLWSIHPDLKDGIFWITTYGGELIKFDVFAGKVISRYQLSNGGLTMMSWFGEGFLLIGSFSKKILVFSLSRGKVEHEIKTRSAVCFLEAIERNCILYTDYDGRVMICDFFDNEIDGFEGDVDRNNPAWSAHPFSHNDAGDNQLIVAWANGPVRVLSYKV